MSWQILDLKRALAAFHEKGYLGQDIPDLVITGGHAAPVESEFFDYKETQEKTPVAGAKLIRHIASFYNSFGGYLLFGVREVESEELFEVVGVPEKLLDLESLKAKTREYLGERIQLSGASVRANTAAGDPVSLYLMYIPKRAENGRPPVHFYKDGPGQIFRRDDVYCRSGDECVEAKGPRLFALTLRRRNPYSLALSNWAFEQAVTPRIQNNLPDRSFVCPKFVGREADLDKLWKWLADDLSHVKMLAGEGGLGKSSIAFEFADRITQVPGNIFEQVVWLTAKRKQFSGKDDSFVAVPETHYSSYDELMKAILAHLPVILEESARVDLPLDELKRYVRDGLADYPSFIVVDDIDSLESEQQRKVVELGLLIGSVKSRLLLTTRHNHAYSQDVAIQIGGFEEPDFSLYLASLRDRKLLARDLNSNQKRKLLEVTQGSPLFVESLCRLLRFQSFEDAIKGWTQGSGTRARMAALDREMSMLSPGAKRVLLGTAFFSEASVPEISEATEYPQEDVLRYIDDLNSLFLLAGQALGEQPRFSVPENTTRLIFEKATEMVTDHKRLENRVKGIRSASSLPPRKKGLGVGPAISQAQAQLRASDRQGALDTIDDALKKLKRNSDLLGVRAEILVRFVPPRYEEARQCARDAYNGKCRRKSTLHAWFQAEWALKNHVGAAECARAALSCDWNTDGAWSVKLAAALSASADAYNSSGDEGRRISTYFEASNALRSGIRMGGYETKAWEGIQYDTHDKIWSQIEDRLDNLDGLDIAVDAVEKFWRTGDYRYRNANRAIWICKSICAFLERASTRKTESTLRASEIRFNRALSLVRERCQHFPDDTRNCAVTQASSAVSERYIIASSV